MVLLKTGDDAERILAHQNLSSLFSIARHISVSPNIYLLRSSAGDDDASLELLKKTNGILLAQKNHETELRAVPNDTMFASQWNMNNTGQTGGTPDADIDAPEAWGITTGGRTSPGRTLVGAGGVFCAGPSRVDLQFLEHYV